MEQVSPGIQTSEFKLSTAASVVAVAIPIAAKFSGESDAVKIAALITAGVVLSVVGGAYIISRTVLKLHQ